MCTGERSSVGGVLWGSGAASACGAGAGDAGISAPICAAAGSGASSAASEMLTSTPWSISTSSLMSSSRILCSPVGSGTSPRVPTRVGVSFSSFSGGAEHRFPIATALSERHVERAAGKVSQNRSSSDWPLVVVSVAPVQNWQCPSEFISRNCPSPLTVTHQQSSRRVTKKPPDLKTGTLVIRVRCRLRPRADREKMNPTKIRDVRTKPGAVA